MTTNKKERERLKDAMMGCLAVSPKRQAEIAEMIKGQLGAHDLETERRRQKKGEETKTDGHQEAA